MSPSLRARNLKDNESLRLENERLQRDLTERDGQIARLTSQLQELQQLGPDRPVGYFAPVKLEIASRSRGADFDGRPGDDGVTVYLRPLDTQNDVVKAPGRARIQVVDNSDLSAPRVLAVCDFADLEKLRDAWHGKFLTQHYTLQCPFPAGAALPPSRTVQVNAEFVDFLSGATLRASADVPISFPAAASP